MTEDRSWDLRYMGKRPWSLNAERRNHRYDRMAMVREYRNTFRLEALRVRMPRPVAHPIHVTAIPHHHNQGHMQDTGNCFPAVKAAVDGLIDARVIPDDGPEWVVGLTFCAPVVDGTNGLQLIVTELADLPSPGPTPENVVPIRGGRS